MNDIEGVHNDHQAILKSILSDAHGVGYTDTQKEDFIAMYKTLNEIPKKDWPKPETLEAVREAADNNG